jgi:tetratricopeptide (TPR) repeat protein
VEYAGCQAVLVHGPVCTLDPNRRLTLWVGSVPDAQIEIEAGGRRLAAAGEPVQAGQRFALKIPSGAERVDVLVEAANGRASWSLSLAEPGSRPGTSRDVLQESDDTTGDVYGLVQQRKLREARKLLETLRLPASAPAEARCLVLYSRGLIHEKEGDYRAALAEVQKAVEIAERVSLKSKQWLAEQKLALLLGAVGRFREATQLFERLRREPRPPDSCERAQLLANEGWSALLAREAGESVEDPTRLLAAALETYETCQGVRPAKKVNVLINLALAHLQEGRVEQAKDLLTRAHELEPHPPVLHTLWSLDLEARIALQEHRPAEALHRFADLEELAVGTSSPDGRLRAALGEAQSQEALRDRNAALETLGKAEALLDQQSLQIPLQEGRDRFMAARQDVVGLHVELLLDQGRNAQALAVARHARSRMLRQLKRSGRLEELTQDQRETWERLLTDYQEKRAALNEQAKDDWKLPADQLRSVRAARKGKAEDLKKLLDKAFLILKDPAERPGEEPPPLRPGELILAYHPLSHGRWIGFAADGEAVAVSQIFELPAEALSRPPKELAELLLRPFSAAINKAKRLRILTSGTLQGVDFQTLPFDGDVLLARIPVVYGLDLPVSPGAAQPGRHALLVADPRGDLPGTLDETRAVGTILKAGSPRWITEELASTQASAEAVRSRLAAADLLHYAGHGTFSGLGGWESSLLLADETQLTLGDVLAIDRVPAWVVLSGCDTGRSSAETPVESLGLAQAFLIAGSRAVVASTRRADDRTVPAFFTDLYRQWDREPDLAVALQRAQLAWRQRNPRADWAGFRLFEP